MPDQRSGCEQAPQNLPDLSEPVIKVKMKKIKQRVVYNAAMPQKLAAILYIIIFRKMRKNG